jgi:hypothetical protein
MTAAKSKKTAIRVSRILAAVVYDPSEVVKPMAGVTAETDAPKRGARTDRRQPDAPAHNEEGKL